jgi:excisionase family DNA binding protein
MRSRSSAAPSRAKGTSELRGACERSARTIVSAVRRAVPGKASRAALTEMANSLTGVIEQTTELLLAGKQVRVIEDDDAITTQEAADLLGVSRPYLVKLLETGQIPQLPKIGRHRRVAKAAVLKYKGTRDAAREAALKELAALSQRHRLGY